MATIGRNMRLCVGRDLRSQTRAVYSGVLGCSVRSPEPDIEIFEFADGRNIGVFYVDPAEALTLDQHTRPIWLELEVEDVQATTAALLAAGARSFDYADKEHPYFQAPGGQIFRLASSQPGSRR